MHYSIVYTLLAAVAGSLVAAQDLSQIPQCAQQAALSSIGSTGCQLTDFACICRDTAFLNSLLPVVQRDCSPADLQKILGVTQTLCLSAGVTLTLPNAASTTAAAASASTAAPITSASTSAPSGTASAASTLSSATGTKTSSGSQSQTPTSATSSPTPSTTITTANSGSRFASAGGFMAAIAVAVAVVGWN